MESYGWPLLTLVLMYGSYWLGKIHGFMDGEDEGFLMGVEQSRAPITRSILKWIRADRDINISDPEIEAIIKHLEVDVDLQNGKQRKINYYE